MGAGEGTLAAFLIQSLNTDVSINYWGIEQDQKFVEAARAKISPLVSSCHIEHGDYFGTAWSIDNDWPSIVIMSHVLYYVKDVEGFIKGFLERLGNKAILISMHAPLGSEHVKMRLVTDARVRTDVCSAVRSACVTDHWSNLFFNSFIYFPENQDTCKSLYYKFL